MLIETLPLITFLLNQLLLQLSKMRLVARGLSLTFADELGAVFLDHLNYFEH